jgi:hypothetical protein
VNFNRVPVNPKILSYSDAPNSLDRTQTRGLIWFQVLIAASYLGIASALVEKVIRSGRVGCSHLAPLGIELEGAMSVLAGMGLVLESGAFSSAALAQVLFGRYSIQQAIDRATALAFELAGGRDFARSGEVSYLVAAARGLSFHPPSRISMAEALGAQLRGEELHGL